MATVYDTTTYTIVVTIGGVAVAPDLVVADVTIRSGRQRADDGLEPASATIELLETDIGSINVALAQTLVVTINGAPRFTGRVTEITRTPIGATGSSWTIVGMGNISRLARFLLALPLPAETATARAERVLTAIGFAHTTTGGGAYTVGPYGQAGDPPATADQILGQLVTDTGVILQDMGDGSILAQFMDSRLSEDQWTPDPAITSTELAFAQSDDLVNDAAVHWTGGTVTASNPASVAQYEKRSISLDTQLNDAGSAQNRANSIIARLAVPAWAIDTLTTWDAAFFDHHVGAIVNVGPLPAGSPVMSPWSGVMEGWTEHYQPSTDGSGRVLGSFLVALGDTQHSSEILTWQGTDPDFKWNTIDQTVTWQEAISNGDLAP
jgi:hypothetical protein